MLNAQKIGRFSIQGIDLEAHMTMARLLSAHGYQDDAMNLPVADLESAVPFYLEKMGFTVVEQTAEPIRKTILERDGIQFAIAENGLDPEQDGCAFHTDDVVALRDEFIANGLET
jgi:hypothetical protein